MTDCTDGGVINIPITKSLLIIRKVSFILTLYGIMILSKIHFPCTIFTDGIFSTVILSLTLIQEEQLSVSGKRMCTILGNHLPSKNVQ